MSKQLTAHFSNDVNQVSRLVHSMERRTGSESAVTIEAFGADTIVTGAVQDVMFIIGEIANNGEATLIAAWQR